MEGYPAYAAVDDRHLYRHPELDKWHLHSKPFDPGTTICVTSIVALGGPVPTGARAWTVAAGGKGVGAEVTARKLDAAAAAALEAARAAVLAAGAAVAAAQGKRVVRPLPPPARSPRPPCRAPPFPFARRPRRSSPQPTRA